MTVHTDEMYWRQWWHDHWLLLATILLSLAFLGALGYKVHKNSVQCSTWYQSATTLQDTLAVAAACRAVR